MKRGILAPVNAAREDGGTLDAPGTSGAPGTPGPEDGSIAPVQLGSGRLFAHVRDAVIVADVTAAEAGVIVLWNPGAEALFGYSSEEAIGLPLEAIMAEGWRSAHRAGVRRFRETGHGQVIDSPAAMAVEGRRANGDVLSVEITLAPLPDLGERSSGPDGAARAGRRGAGARYVLAVVRDVTERRRLEEALVESERARREEAEARLEGVQLAAREVADLLGNALVTPRTAVEMLAQEPLPPALLDLARRAVDDLRRAGEHLARLQRVERIETHDTPVGPALDLQRSSEPTETGER